ncbi:hypothetical protein PDL71_01045 [Lacibacter sp. MH-610]|uniref:hypothetical protein n=1 Tax=Lacibacter sp. MH-610 TaxID=3020883 RepID=UPI0038923777
MKKNILLFYLLFLVLFSSAQTKTYESLLQLTKELRQLERTSLPNGVPDYRSATVIKIQQSLAQLKNRHAKIDTSSWSLEHKVDYVLVLSEMNALDFNCRILKPWVRDPSFYAIIFAEQSDTPEHEGPTSFAAIELWQYNFPLTAEQEQKLIAQLKVIPPLYEQAKMNLTGTARDLWTAGTKDVQAQLSLLDELSSKTINNTQPLKDAITNAKKAVTTFANWLLQETPNKTGPSGIGKENYTWFLRNVMLIPFSWQDEVTLLNRELTRAFASMQLEQENYRNLPPLQPYKNEQEYNAGADAHVNQLMRFLKEKNIMPVKSYMEPALRKHMGSFIPEAQRNFFGNISHHAPGVLYSHLTHWFEIAGLTEEPHPNVIRREALAYNIWMQRSEGLATSLEETFMLAGLWNDNPRAKELVWIMLAQRCARGLASLYAQANMMNYEEARSYQMNRTPAGWAGDESLAGFEQHLYLRQPGYGTSYVTGKYFIERMMMDVSRQQGKDYTVYKFFDRFYNAGIMPVSLVNWQLTGDDSLIKACFKK